MYCVSHQWYWLSLDVGTVHVDIIFPLNVFFKAVILKTLSICLNKDLKSGAFQGNEKGWLVTMGCFAELDLRIAGVESMHEPKSKRQEVSVMVGNDWDVL